MKNTAIHHYELRYDGIAMMPLYDHVRAPNAVNVHAQEQMNSPVVLDITKLDMFMFVSSVPTGQTYTKLNVNCRRPGPCHLLN